MGVVARITDRDPVIHRNARQSKSGSGAAALQKLAHSRSVPKFAEAFWSAPPQRRFGFELRHASKRGKTANSHFLHSYPR